MAAEDISTWATMVKDSLPNGQALICVDANNSPTVSYTPGNNPTISCNQSLGNQNSGAVFTIVVFWSSDAKQSFHALSAYVSP